MNFHIQPALLDSGKIDVVYLDGRQFVYPSKTGPSAHSDDFDKSQKQQPAF